MVIHLWHEKNPINSKSKKYKINEKFHDNVYRIMIEDKIIYVFRDNKITKINEIIVLNYKINTLYSSICAIGYSDYRVELLSDDMKNSIDLIDYINYDKQVVFVEDDLEYFETQKLTEE